MQLVGIPAGQTIIRVRFAWGFGGYTGTSVVPQAIMTRPMTLGLVTTIGNGSETVPDPVSASTDASPPAQRWLWWEQRAPTVVAWDPASSVAVWQSSPPQEAVDAKAQVRAPTMPGGDTLNLWVSYKSVAAWDASGQAEVWAYWAVLVKS